MLSGASLLHPRSPPDSQTLHSQQEEPLLPKAFSWSSVRPCGLSDTHLPGSTSPLLRQLEMDGTGLDCQGHRGLTPPCPADSAT